MDSNGGSKAGENILEFVSGDQWSSNWQKIKSWATVQMLIINKLSIAESDYNQDLSITHGFALSATLKHAEHLRALTHFKVPSGLIFISCSGSELRNFINVWNVHHLGTTNFNKKTFPIITKCELIKYIPKYRKVVVYSPDLKIKLLDDILKSFEPLDELQIPFSLFCIEYNSDTDEILCGGVGGIIHFRITSNFKLEEIPAAKIPLTKLQWCTSLMVDTKNKQIMVISDDCIYLYNYVKNVCTHTLQNRHSLPLTCCAHYEARDYFITASKDGTIRIWNGLVLTQVQELIAHAASVTGLQLHKTEPLLISCSLDGLVKIWRLDTFDLFMRLDVNEKVKGLTVLNTNDLFVFTDRSIKLYTINMLYSFYAAMYTTVTNLKRVDSVGKEAVIIGAGSDGAFRVLTALKAEQYTTVFPQTSYKDGLSQVCYQLEMIRPTNEIFLLLGTGDVVVYDSLFNPCRAKYMLQADRRYDEQILSITLIKHDRAVGKPETDQTDNLIFAGHQNGEISLLHSNKCRLLDICRAHLAPVQMLYTSTGRLSASAPNSKICEADRLVSWAADLKLKVWALVFEMLDETAMTLICLKSIELSEVDKPIKLCMVGSTIALAMPQSTADKKDKSSKLLMYWLSDLSAATPESSRGSNKTLTASEAPLLKATPKTGIYPMFHSKAFDHESEITGLDGHHLLQIFVTTSWDGVLKIWDKQNNLLRELILSPSLSGICFADEKGTLVIGYKNHLSCISVDTYLPADQLRSILLNDYKDVEDEMGIEFKPEIPIKDYYKLEKFPAVNDPRRNIRLNRDFKQGHAVDTPTEFTEGVEGDGDYAKVFKRLGVSAKMARKLTPSIVPKVSVSKTTVRESVDESEVQTASVTLTQDERNKYDSDRLKREYIRKKYPPPKPDLTIEPPVKMSKFEFEMAVSRLSKNRHEKIREENKRRMEVAQLQKIERNRHAGFYPLAPDGAIPNSVIREWMRKLCRKNQDQEEIFSLAALIAKLPGMAGTEQNIKKYLKKESTRDVRKLIPERTRGNSVQTGVISLKPDQYEEFMGPIVWTDTNVLDEITHFTMKGDRIIDLAPRSAVNAGTASAVGQTADDCFDQFSDADEDEISAEDNDRNTMRRQGVTLLKALYTEEWMEGQSGATVSDIIKHIAGKLPQTKRETFLNMNTALRDLHESFLLPEGTLPVLANSLIRSLHNYKTDDDMILSTLYSIDELGLEAQSTMREELKHLAKITKRQDIKALAERLVSKVPDIKRPVSSRSAASKKRAEIKMVKAKKSVKHDRESEIDSDAKPVDDSQVISSEEDQIVQETFAGSTSSDILASLSSRIGPRTLKRSATSSVVIPTSVPTGTLSEEVESHVQRVADKFLHSLEKRGDLGDFADKIQKQPVTDGDKHASKLERLAALQRNFSQSSESDRRDGTERAQSEADKTIAAQQTPKPPASPPTIELDGTIEPTADKPWIAEVPKLGELAVLDDQFRSLTLSASNMVDIHEDAMSNNVCNLNSDFELLSDADSAFSEPGSNASSAATLKAESSRLPPVQSAAGSYNYTVEGFLGRQALQSRDMILPPISSTDVNKVGSRRGTPIRVASSPSSKTSKARTPGTQPELKEGRFPDGSQLTLQNHLLGIHATKQHHTTLSRKSEDEVSILLKDLWGQPKPLSGPRFEWSSPMPPPPQRGLDVTDSIAKLHSEYCEYWRCVKNKMQNYISISNVLQRMKTAKDMVEGRRDYKRRALVNSPASL